MNRINKRGLFVFICAAALAVSLCGCGGMPQSGGPTDTASSEDGVAPDKSETSADSSELFRIEKTGVDAPDGFQGVRLAFLDREHHAGKPVQVDLVLPETWEATVADGEVIPGTAMPCIGLTSGGQTVGYVDVNPFSQTEQAASGEESQDMEDIWVYFGGTLVGNHYYGKDYQSLTHTDTVETGLCKIEYDGKFDPDGEGYSYDGILSANIPMEVYAQVVLTGPELTEDQIQTVADSITLSDAA